jgi:hypothetical protein
VLAALLGVEVDERRCEVDFAVATRDLDLPGRPIAAGTVAGLDVTWQGMVDGDPAVALHQRWVMGRDVEPAWSVEHGYVVEVDGDPHVRLKLDIGPDLHAPGALTTAGIHAIGMRITGVPAVNAIPAVCRAAPGIRTYADLPAVTTRIG